MPLDLKKNMRQDRGLLGESGAMQLLASTSQHAPFLSPPGFVGGNVQLVGWENGGSERRYRCLLVVLVVLLVVLVGVTAVLGDPRWFCSWFWLALVLCLGDPLWFPHGFGAAAVLFSS